MLKTAIRLADGRELIYFDAVAGARRDARDVRTLDVLHRSSELRYDPLLDLWVIYASHRQDRSFLPSTEECPLCPTRVGHLSEIPAPSYEVVVFENRFPALGTASAGELAGASGPPASLLFERPAAGRCEVICYSDEHDATFAGLSEQRVRLVLEALVDRSTELAELPGVEQGFCFENRGKEIGVTQTHPHGQIYAYPFVTPRTQRMLSSVEAHFRRTGRNLFDDLVQSEREARSRVVLQSEHWTAFVPHAARWPYEVHCYPNVRVPDLAELAPDAFGELAAVELDLFGRFARLFDAPAPYIAAWHQAPVAEGRRHFALHLELFTVRRTNDKLKYLAGSESGMDAFANDVVPEVAAARLREVGR